jgi:hypothetical protein
MVSVGKEQDLENFPLEGAVDAGFFYESENDWSSDGIGTLIPCNKQTYHHSESSK